MLRRNHKWMLLAALVLCLLGLAQYRPATVQAQCGTQASSCKNCHEVQAKDPVNTKGAWHTDHAFGDFCEYCHAGNVQAKDKAAAHQGLVAWNADVKASCATCHAADYEKRGQTYAATLGVSLNTGAAATGTKPSSTALDATSACAPQGGEEIDYNLLYAQHVAPPPLVSNWGNVILGIMTLGLGTVFFGTAWTWEGWGRKVGAWVRNNVSPIPGAVSEVSRRGRSGGDSEADAEQNQDSAQGDA